MILKIFDYLRKHAIARWASLLAITLVLMASIVRLSYKEDIQDFLPLIETDRQRMAVYQDISGMNRLFVVFESIGDVEKTTEAIECFVNGANGGFAFGDLEGLSETMDFVYQNAPLFLTDDDYKRMDSLLASPDFVDNKLEDDLNALMLPTGSLLSQSISRDPLGLIAPVVEEMQLSHGQMRFEIYDGYIFTPDMKKALVLDKKIHGGKEVHCVARPSHP